MGKKVILLIFGVLLLDQIVKILVKTHMDALEQVSVVDGFFQLYYIENRGMAFGTTLGSGALAKYALSIFRLVAIIGIGYYIFKLLKEKHVHPGLIISVGFIFAGATGNLIDGMFYDIFWEIDPDIAWNWARDGDGQWVIDGTGGPALRPHGFMLGSVVDMFQFTMKWPSWMPFGLAGSEVFAAIWNVADGSITLGVAIIVIRYKTFFKKPPVENDEQDNPESEIEKVASNDSSTAAPTVQ